MAAQFYLPAVVVARENQVDSGPRRPRKNLRPVRQEYLRFAAVFLGRGNRAIEIGPPRAQIIDAENGKPGISGRERNGVITQHTDAIAFKPAGEKTVGFRINLMVCRCKRRCRSGP